MDYFVVTELLRSESELVSTLEQAQQFAQWFAEYMYGMHDMLPEDVPMLVHERLQACFDGRSDVTEFEQVRDRFIGIDEDNQRGMALYFSGYPDDSIDMLVDEPDSFRAFLATTFPPSDSGVVTAERTEMSLPKRSEYPVMRQEKAALTDTRIAGVALSDFVYLHGEAALDDIFGNGVEHELPWQARALCAQTDPEAFFPEKGGSTREAKKVCLSCDVREECLHYALDNDERFGIWGGLSERERRKYKKHGAVSVEQRAKIEPLLKRPRRIEQLLVMMSAAQEETDMFFDRPEQFARLVYSVLEKIYPESDEENEAYSGRRARLLDYFILEKKEQKLHEIWDELTKDLDELSYEIAHDKKEYEVDRTHESPSYILSCLADWQGDEGIGVSRLIRKKPRWMHEIAKQDANQG